MRYDNFIPQPRLVEIRSRGRLPHWEVDQATYFITFGLKDCLPRHVAISLFRERDQLLRGARTDSERAQISRAFQIHVDRAMDQGAGSCLLREHAALVANALKFFDGVRYALQAWYVMPNHVHVLVDLTRGAELAKVVHSWKSYTAHEIGKGVIWQREYFDRVIRSPRELSDTRTYIWRNPAKAGLVDGPWVG